MSQLPPAAIDIDVRLERRLGILFGEWLVGIEVGGHDFPELRQGIRQLALLGLESGLLGLVRLRLGGQCRDLLLDADGLADQLAGLLLVGVGQLA
jgi:hypothetical protein